MSIFKEMHETHSFSSYEEFDELRRMLASAISRGFVEEVSVMKPSQFSPNMVWYRDKETGEIYSLTPPNPPARGWWERVDIGELKEPGQFVQ
jgi:hypothetical protein